MEEQKNSNSIVEQTKISRKKSPIKMFAVGFVVLLIISFIGIFSYTVVNAKNLSTSPFTLGLTKFFHLSAAKINGIGISYNDYIDELKNLNYFYDNQTDYTKPTNLKISDQVLSRLMVNALVNDLSKKEKIKITDEDVAKIKEDFLSQYPSEDKAEEDLMLRYGWSLEKYLTKAVKPLLLAEKLQARFAETATDESEPFVIKQTKASFILFKTKIQAQSILNKIEAGENFSTLAEELKTKNNVLEVGEWGWLSQGQMVESLENVIFNLEPGQVSDEIIQTESGFYLIRVEECRFVRDYLAFIDNAIKESKIKILVNIHNPFEALQKRKKQVVNDEMLEKEEITYENDEKADLLDREKNSQVDLSDNLEDLFQDSQEEDMLIDEDVLIEEVEDIEGGNIDDLTEEDAYLDELLEEEPSMQEEEMGAEEI